MQSNVRHFDRNFGFLNFVDVKISFSTTIINNYTNQIFKC